MSSSGARRPMRSVRANAGGLSARAMRRQAARYIAVGILGYALQVGSFAVLVHEIGVPYVAAAVVAGLLALLNNFVLNRHWTFEATHGRVRAQATAYAVISAVFFGLQLALLTVLVGLGVPKVPSEALAVIAIVPGNFAAQRHFAFS